MPIISSQFCKLETQVGFTWTLNLETHETEIEVLSCWEVIWWLSGRIHFLIQAAGPIHSLYSWDWGPQGCPLLLNAVHILWHEYPSIFSVNNGVLNDPLDLSNDPFSYFGPPATS